MKLFRDAGTADNVATLEHERLESSFREIESSDQTIMAGANDDDVVCLCQCSESICSVLSGRAAPYSLNYVSFKISIAALRPLAPMMPPPGCVADPHM